MHLLSSDSILMLDMHPTYYIGMHAAETVTESPADNFEMPHTTSTGCVTPSGLYRPAITTCFGGRISTLGAGFLLDMKADTATTTTQSVCLVAPFTKRTCSLGHFYLPKRNRKKE